MHRLAQHAAVALGAPSSCVENRPAARRGSVQGSPRLKAVLSVFWAIFHAGNSHFRANRGGAARCEQPGVRGVARGGARAQRCASCRFLCEKLESSVLQR